MPLLTKRAFIIIMLFLCGVLNYLDRTVFGVCSVFIANEFGFDQARLGIIFSCFSLGYISFNVLGGILADKFGPKHVLLAAVIGWSLFSGATVIAVGFISLLMIRVVFGMAEGPLSTTTNKTIDPLYPPDKKASVMGIVASGTPLGAAVAGPIVSFIAIKYNWKLSFIFIMVIGLIWSFFWWKYIANKKLAKTENEDSAKAKQEIISSTKFQQKLKMSFYLKQKVIIASAVAFFSYNYIIYLILNWFPYYLMTVRNFSLKDTGLITVIPWTLGFVGLAIGGIISDFIMRRIGHPLIARKIVIGFGLLVGAISIFLVPFVDSSAMVVCLVSMSAFSLYLTGGVYWGVINDIVDTGNIGSVGGIMHGFGNCGGLFAPTVTGFAVKFTGSFTGSFVLAGVIGLTGAIGAFLFINKIKADKAEINKYTLA
ncbi:MAG: MFS transporter [Endomicrobium sp.]|nr:MFS transporter [Endomicrobium sp.]